MTGRGGGLAAGLALCLVAGCGYGGLAAETARAQSRAAEMVRRDSAIAYSLCRDQAHLAYLQARLGLGREGPLGQPPPFHAWYATAPATRSGASWVRYCGELDQTGTVYHASVLALRDYARAVAALAEGEDFDGSGLAKVGENAASFADRLSASGAVVSTIKGAGSAASALSAAVVKELRTQAVRTLIAGSIDEATAVTRSLRDYLAALEDERRLTLHRREIVARAIEARREPGGPLSAAAELAIAFDMAASSEARFARIGRIIAEDVELLGRIEGAQRALAAAAVRSEEMKAAKQASVALQRAIDELADARPEAPR